MSVLQAPTSEVEPLAVVCQGLDITIGERMLLEAVDFGLRSGRSAAVMGPSGSGKTTLLNCLAGLHRPAAGSVRLGDVDLAALGTRQRSRVRLARIGMVFQFGELIPELNVAENVELPLRLLGDSAPDRVTATLADLGLADRGTSMPHQLSGGEQQRVAIARALVKEPALVLADEPTGALDEEMSTAVCDLLLEAARRRGAGVVIATHDPLVAERVDDVYVVKHLTLRPR